MNAFLIDCEHLSRVCGRLRKDLPQMTGHAVPEADLARWLECALLDALQAAGITDTKAATGTTQVYLFHENGAETLENFLPTHFNTELDGQAFNGPAGEFLLAACPTQPNLGSKETLYCETLQSLLRTGKSNLIIIAADFEAYGTRIDQLLADYPDARAILLTLSPDTGSNNRATQIGFSLLAALGIRSSEIQ